MSTFVTALAEKQKQRARDAVYAARNEVDDAVRKIALNRGIDYTHLYRLYGATLGEEAEKWMTLATEQIERRYARELVEQMKDYINA